MAGISQCKIAIIDAHYPHYQAEQEILAPFQAKLDHFTTNGDPIKIREAVRGVKAVLVREMPISAETISAMQECEIIVRYGVGVDNIDLAAARERHIYVSNVPDYGTHAVSDHAVALMLAVARRIVQRDHAVRDGAWNIGAAEPIHSFYGKTLGLVGYGRIGRLFHQKAAVFGFEKVLVYDPFLKDVPGDVDVVGLETLCQQADVISLHTPLTKDNYHLLNATRLDILKPTAIIINTSRGGLIDEDALINALQTKKLFGAGLDVYESEPPKQNHPLFSLDNVVLTDHTAWYSQESLYELQKKAAQEVARVFSGDSPLSWVNRWED